MRGQQLSPPPPQQSSSPAYKPGSVGSLSTSGRSFLSERSHLRPLAAYPQRLDRGGRPLAAYLALLRLGFTLPHLLPDARWALTRTFSPLPVPTETAGHRRCVFCGTFRRAARYARTTRPGVTWQPVHGARTFLEESRTVRLASLATVRPVTYSTIAEEYSQLSEEMVATCAERLR